MRNTHLKVDVLNAMVIEAEAGRPAPQPCQYGYDSHDRAMVAFLATDKETGKPLQDRNGNLKFNWKPSRTVARTS